ncbi:hypothetical protein BIWAKO_03304 [Bosea sp. BIWAKO-01]|nr:hypothetical protein BIWAKO_03304 [Bosea sp. BIWAKO-01]
MTRFSRIIGIMSLAVLLSGCDKCGEFMKLDIFGQPVKTCSGNNPQG